MIGKNGQQAKPNVHSNNLAGIRGTMHSETDKYDSTIRVRGISWPLQRKRQRAELREQRVRVYMLLGVG